MYMIYENMYFDSGKSFYFKSGDPSSLSYHLFPGELHSDCLLLPEWNGIDKAIHYEPLKSFRPLKCFIQLLIQINQASVFKTMKENNICCL